MKQMLMAMLCSALSFATASAVALPTVAEVEPNDALATATVLMLNGGRAIGAGQIAAGDADYWRIDNVLPNSKAWVYVDTGGVNANSRDSTLSLIAGNGNLLEFDDDDGTANGLDGTVEGGLASVIAGSPLAAGGTYYLKITGFNGTTVIDSYRMYVVITGGNVGESEVEPNGTAGLADRIGTGTSPVGIRTGTIVQPGDEDYFSVPARAGDILYLALDTSPARVDAGADLVLTFRDRDGTSILLTCDSSTLGTSAASPAAEGCAYLVPTSGVYYATVHHSAAVVSGAYALMVANMTRPVLDFTAEVEPNNTPATATYLPMNGGRAMGIGSITPAADADYWRFDLNVPGPSSLIWVHVDTGGPQNPGGTSRDSFVTVYAADGTTVLASDDDSGTGNGLDGTIESGQASATATALLSNGTYFVKVTAISPADTISPYRLYVASASQFQSIGDAEPNNTPGTGQTISTPGSPIHYTSTNTISPAGDVDYFRVVAGAGDVILMMLDSWVNGALQDMVIDLYDRDGATKLLTCDSAGTGTPTSPPREGCAYRIGVEGNYYVAVRHFNPLVTAAQYHLLVANMTQPVTLALPIDETIPGSTPATAHRLDLNGGRATAEGAIAAGDIRMYRIDGIVPGSRIWAYVDTGGTASPGSTSRDSRLWVFAADGTTVIEFDDDDGTGNGLDSTVETLSSSVIAGRVLVAGGTYYLRVDEFTLSGVINPYSLYVVVTAPGSEQSAGAGSNNSALTANPIIEPGKPVGVRNSLLAGAEQDYYAATLDAGDILVVAVDGDPARSGTGLDVAADLLDVNGVSLLLTCNSTHIPADPPGEGCGFEVPAAGTYFIRVRVSNGADSGSYSVMAAKMNELLTLDIDASNPATTYDALTDGVLVVRYLLGLTGNALTENAIGGTASRGTATALLDYLNLAATTLDIDADGTTKPETDGLLILRYLLGYRGAALIDNVVAPGAARTTANAIETYIRSLMP